MTAHDEAAGEGKANGQRKPATAKVTPAQATAKSTRRPRPPRPTTRLDADTVRTAAAADGIAYDVAVMEGKKLAAVIAVADVGQMRLGEIAHKLYIKPKHADRTLATYAKDIGVEPGTLKRYRTVYRQWLEIGAPAPQSYSVASDLAKHPDAAAIVRDNPNITKAAARKALRDCKKRQQAEQENKKGGADWRRAENEEWQRELQIWITKGEQLASMAGQPLTPTQRRILSEVLEPQLLSQFEKLLGYLKALVRQKREAA